MQNLVRTPIDSSALPAQYSGFEAVLGKFGLSGREPWTLLDAGLDSIRLVELSLDLKAHLATQGHGHLAEVVDLRVLQKIEISELNDLLVHSSRWPHHRLKRASARLWADLRQEHRKLEREMMRRDTRLRFSPSHLPVCASTMSVAPDGVLLTGGTGFFGPFLLASLLRQTQRPDLCPGSGR